MAKGKDLFRLIEYAEDQGATMSELAQRANSVRRAKIRKERLIKEQERRYQEIVDAGQDWWNR